MASPATPEGVRVQVSRDLGVFDVTMAALGAMLGAGIFVLAGSAARVAGSAAWLALLLSGFVALLSALAYAELASNRPSPGGGYAWVSEALPAPSGFLSGWLTWAGHIAAAALSALGIAVFLDFMLDLSGIPGYPWTLNLGFVQYNVSEKVIGLFVLVGILGLRFLSPTGAFRRAGYLSLLKVLLLAVFIGAGFALALGSPVSSRLAIDLSRLQALPLAAGVVFIAYQGFESVAQRSEHVKTPERTIPLGIFLALGIAAALYAVFEAVLLAMVPDCGGPAWACLANGPRSALGPPEPELGSLFAATALGPVGLGFLFGTAVVSMASALASNMDSATRTVVTMSREGALPAGLAHVTDRRIPAVGIGATGVFAGLLLLAMNVEQLAVAAGILFLIQYSFVNIAVVILRRRSASARGFRAPFVPVTSVLATILSLALAVSLWSLPLFQPGELVPPGRPAWYFAGLWLVVGLIVHFFAGGRQKVARVTADVHPDVLDIVAEGETPIDVERYRVFLPLREFTDTALVEFGATVARRRGGELSLLHVVEVPRNLPPKAIRFRYVDDKIRGLQRLSRIGTHEGVDTRAVVKIGSKVYEIILDTLRDEAVNLLVMGWRGERVQGDRRILGSNIDYLIENAPCDLVVFKTKGMRRPLRRIVLLQSALWPLGGIGDIAVLLAERDRAAISILTLAEDPAQAESLKADANPLVERCHALELEVDQKVVYSRALDTTALREGAGADLLMVRASRPAPRGYVLGPVEDRIAKLARSPVLIFRAGSPA